MGGVALLVLSSMAPLACAGRQQTKRSESAHLVCLEGKESGHRRGACGKGMVMLAAPPAVVRRTLWCFHHAQ